MVSATMAVSELLASLTQPTPATPTHELRFSLIDQSALIFLPLTQVEAPMPPVPASPESDELTEAGGSAVGTAGAPAAPPLELWAAAAAESMSCAGLVSAMVRLPWSENVDLLDD